MVLPKGRRPAMIWLVSALCCVGFPCAGLALLSFFAKAPEGLGVKNGRLAACPASPNCVSTQAETQQHWIAPLTPPGGEEQPIARLAGIVKSLSGTTVVQQSDRYLRAEFRSLIFRFCDDVEFFHDASQGRIHFRSASRVGHSDLGVNRKRMEEIRRLFEASAPPVMSEPSVRRQGNRSQQELQLARTGS